MASAVYVASNEVSAYRERLRRLDRETEHLRVLFAALRSRSASSVLRPAVDVLAPSSVVDVSALLEHDRRETEERYAAIHRSDSVRSVRFAISTACCLCMSASRPTPTAVDSLFSRACRASIAPGVAAIALAHEGERERTASWSTISSSSCPRSRSRRRLLPPRWRDAALVELPEHTTPRRHEVLLCQPPLLLLSKRRDAQINYKTPCIQLQNQSELHAFTQKALICV